MTNHSLPLIALSQASKIYGRGEASVRALDSVSLTVARGDFVALIGPSGSGKSTLMNIIGGLDTLTSGTFYFAGVSINGLDAAGRSRYRQNFVGFVFQGFNLLRRTTALENVELPLLYRRVPYRERRTRALEALEQVGLADRAHHTAAQLSGGQQQRVAIARALACRPLLLVADEPTGNLDSGRTAEILTLLEEMNRVHGTTLVVVTHETEVAAHARRIVEFRDGRISRDDRSEISDVA